MELDLTEEQRLVLKTAGEFESIGGAAYLSKVVNAVPNAAHATYYAEIVREKATYRSLIFAATEILRDCRSAFVVYVPTYT